MEPAVGSQAEERAWRWLAAALRPGVTPRPALERALLGTLPALPTALCSALRCPPPPSRLWMTAPLRGSRRWGCCLGLLTCRAPLRWRPPASEPTTCRQVRLDVERLVRVHAGLARGQHVAR